MCFTCECVRHSNTLYHHSFQLSTFPSPLPPSHTHTHTHKRTSFSRHPQVQTNRQTELHYEEVQFFSDDTLYQRGIQWSVSSHTLSHTQLIHGGIQDLFLGEKGSLKSSSVNVKFSPIMQQSVTGSSNECRLKPCVQFCTYSTSSTRNNKCVSIRVCTKDRHLVHCARNATYIHTTQGPLGSNARGFHRLDV